MTHQGDRGSQPGVDRDYFRFRIFQPERVNIGIVNGSLPDTKLELLTATGALIHQEILGPGGSISFQEFLHPSSFPASYYAVVDGSAPPSFSGVGQAGTPCDQQNLIIRDAYLLTVAPEPRTVVDLIVMPPTVALGESTILTAEVDEPDGTNPGAGIEVRFSPLYGTGYVGCTVQSGSCVTSTDINGRATVSFASPANGTYPFAASAMTGGSDTASLLVGNSQIVASASPNPVSVGQPSTLSATIYDASGSPVGQGVPVTFSTGHPGFFTGNGASSSTSPSTVMTNAAGATWIWFASPAEGSANITIESDSAAPVVLPVEIINPNANLNIDITIGFITGSTNSSTYEIQAVVTDSSGAPIPGERVDFTASRGTLSADHDFTGPSGIADTNLTITTSGDVTVTATANSVTAGATFFGQVGEPDDNMLPVRQFSLGDDVFGVAFSPGGETLAAVSYSQSFRGWNTADFSSRWSSVTQDNSPGQLDFSPDGAYIMIPADDGVQIHRANDGGFHCEGTNALSRHTFGAFLGNTSYADVGFDSGAGLERVFKYTSLCGVGSTIASADAGEGFERLSHMDYNATKGWLAASTDEGYTYVWNTSGSRIQKLLVAAGANAHDTDFVTNGSRLAAVGYQAVKVFNTTTWSAQTFGATSLGPWKYSVKFIDNDSKLIVGGDSKIEMMDAASGASLRTGDVAGRAIEMAWNPSTGDLAVGTNLGSLYIFKPLEPNDTITPTISVSHPPEPFVTNSPNLTIVGRVTDNVAVTDFAINGAPVSLNTNGDFSHPVVLSPGANTLSFAASDLAGNGVTLQRNATYVVDSTAPVISSVLLAPTSGAPGTLFTLECSVVDGDSGVAFVEADIRDSGGALVTTVALSDISGSTWHVEIDSLQMAGGFYSIDLRAVDTSPQANQRLVGGAAGFTVAGIFTDGFESGGVLRWISAEGGIER